MEHWKPEDQPAGGAGLGPSGLPQSRSGPTAAGAAHSLVTITPSSDLNAAATVVRTGPASRLSGRHGSALATSRAESNDSVSPWHDS